MHSTYKGVSFLACFILFFSFISNTSAQEFVTRTIENKETGGFSISYPENWQLSEHRNIENQAKVLRFTSPPLAFFLGVSIHEKSAIKIATLIDSELEIYMNYYLSRNTSLPLEQSVEKTITPERFGKESDGVYVLLTDAQYSPQPDEFKYWIAGLRLIGDNAIFFDFYSIDLNEKATILSIVDSIVFNSTD